jgi:hypothetical protein
LFVSVTFFLLLVSVRVSSIGKGECAYIPGGKSFVIFRECSTVQDTLEEPEDEQSDQDNSNADNSENEDSSDEEESELEEIEEEADQENEMGIETKPVNVCHLFSFFLIYSLFFVVLFFLTSRIIVRIKPVNLVWIVS